MFKKLNRIYPHEDRKEEYKIGKILKKKNVMKPEIEYSLNFMDSKNQNKVKLYKAHNSNRQYKFEEENDSDQFSNEEIKEVRASQSNQNLISGGWVPSIPHKDERCETFETDISALNLSPRSKAIYKIRKLIKTSFQKTGTGPDSTSEFYRVGKVLGRGAFGKVSLAVHRLTDEMVAIKSINKEVLTDEASKNKVMKEVTILKKMRHKNIIQLLDTFETDKHIIFVMELCSGGDLLNYVRKRRKLTEDYAKTIFKQILEALHYCHNLNILHRDIKLDNIILDSEGVIKVGDFGVSKIVDPVKKMFDQWGTPAYIAPEILKDKGYTGFGIDVWSSGVVLFAMLYGTVPFKAQSMSDLHNIIIKGKYVLKPDISDSAIDLLKNILEPNPRKRLSIPQIFVHPWFWDLKNDLEMFTDEEKEKIREEFSYNNVKNGKQILDTDISWDFTEHQLETIDNDDLRNLTTKSVILAPFNSTTSRVPTEEQEEIKEMLRERRAVKFNAKCRDFNRQYEMNNNCELDNGVYNKFMESSRTSLHYSPSHPSCYSDGLSGGDSLQMSFKKKEKEIEECDDEKMNKQIEDEIQHEKEKREKDNYSEFEKITHATESKF
jgi:serine/threonine protein kinase